jgi:membrane-associated phospholipid phosphatase
LVNVVLKDHWGRPRPAQIEAFGGSHTFSQPWEKTDFTGGRSFPSGHSSVAFYMMAPYFLLRRTRKKAAYTWLRMGLAYGILMGIARVVQGGHFVSDVLWAGGIIYLTGLLLASLLGFDAQSKHSRNPITRPSVSPTIPRDHARCITAASRANSEPGAADPCVRSEKCCCASGGSTCSIQID